MPTAMLSKDKKHILDAVMVTAFFLLAIWTVFLMDTEWGFHLKQYGVHPRRASGLIGIFTHGFLHGGYEHIWHNTMSFAVLNTFLFYFYRPVALKTFGIIFLFTGVLLWIIGGVGNHIGASGIIYGLAAFLFFSGVFRKNQRMLRVALVVAFAYGSFFWYMFPIDVRISWEGHLSGAVVGFACALLFREQGPARKRYNWEIQEEIDEVLLNRDTVDLNQERIQPGYGLRPRSNDQGFVYHFKPREE